MVAIVHPPGEQDVPGARSSRSVRSVPVPASTYRRRRAVAAGLAAVVVMTVRAALGSFGGAALPASERPGLERSPGAVYVVQPGDTFWSLALQLAPGADPRPMVDRMVAAHGGASLQAGERIVLPARR